MKTVEDVLQEKGRTVWTLEPDATVYEALALMAARDTGAVLVMEGDRLVGMITERDCARKLDLQGRTARRTLVREIMTPRVRYVSPQQTIDECMALMVEKRIRHLPVLRGEDLVGMVSMRDVVRAVIAEKELEIAQLEDYIKGQEPYF